MRTTKQQARHAGLLYFILGITAPIGLEFVPGKLLVAGDATATSAHLRTFELLWRIGLASELFHQIVVVYLVLALFRLFKPVNESLAWQVVIFGALVSVPIMFINVVNGLAALMLASPPPFLAVIEPRQLDALSYLFVRMHSLGIEVASIFWGIWLFPFGALVMRCGFMPRWLGWSMWVAGVAYLAAATAQILAPQIAHAVGQVAGILEFGELPIIFWLLIWGAREPTASAAPAQPSR